MKIITNQNGFTYILALTIVMIMGIMLGLVGQSWKTIKQREQEKELLFRGSQIKEAIENWYNVNTFKPAGMPHGRNIRPLLELEDLLKDKNIPTTFRYIPHSYAAKLDDKNTRCAPDCPTLKILQDPMTGKKWTVIRGTYSTTTGAVPSAPGTQSGGIIGVASQSDETPFRTDFKNTSLENMGQTGIVAVPPTAGGLSPSTIPLAVPGPGGTSLPPGLGGKMTKYSEWQFIAESIQKNDHTKIYRAYHEGW